MACPKSARLSEPKRERYTDCVGHYFARIDTNPLAQVARVRLRDLIARHNQRSTSMERDGLYKTIKYMARATAERDKRWFSVPIHLYADLVFYDRVENGQKVYRNMPLRKKRRTGPSGRR